MRMKMGPIVILAGFLAVALGARAQNPPQQPPPKPPAAPEKAKEQKKKTKRVWGEEDIRELRKPWDQHADQKAAEAVKAEEAAKAAEAQAAGAPAGEGEADAPIDPATGKPRADPNSPEAIEKRLKAWENELKRTEELAVAARKEVTQYAGVDADRWESAKLKAETYEQNMVEIQKKIEETRAELAEAKKQRPGAKPAAAPRAGPPPPAAPQ